MKISTRGRYALRVMIDLAEHNSGEYIPLTDIAGRQEISEKYLESIVSMLSKSGFLMSLRGKGGGYRLTRLPEEPTHNWEELNAIFLGCLKSQIWAMERSRSNPSSNAP